MLSVEAIIKEMMGLLSALMMPTLNVANNKKS